MNQVLSQSEVDALLNAVMDPSAAPDAGGGDVSGEKAPTAINVMPYDLGNQDRVIRGRMMTLDIIYERFIRNYFAGVS